MAKLQVQKTPFWPWYTKCILHWIIESQKYNSREVENKLATVLTLRSKRSNLAEHKYEGNRSKGCPFVILLTYITPAKDISHLSDCRYSLSRTQDTEMIFSSKGHTQLIEKSGSRLGFLDDFRFQSSFYQITTLCLCTDCSIILTFMTLSRFQTRIFIQKEGATVYEA